MKKVSRSDRLSLKPTGKIYNHSLKQLEVGWLMFKLGSQDIPKNGAALGRGEAALSTLGLGNFHPPASGTTVGRAENFLVFRSLKKAPPLWTRVTWVAVKEESHF